MRFIDLFLHRLTGYFFFVLLLRQSTIKDRCNVVFVRSFSKRNVVAGCSRQVRCLSRSYNISPSKYDCNVCRLVHGRPSNEGSFPSDFPNMKDGLWEALRIDLGGGLFRSSSEDLFFGFS